MMAGVKILILLWTVNLTPALLTYYLDRRWGRPLDGGRRWRDGRPLLGSHKTIRGLVGAVAIGTLAGVYLGLPAWLGMSAAVLSMAGDLISSFLKRRLGKVSGAVVPGLDQILEGALPLSGLGALFRSGRRHGARAGARLQHRSLRRLVVSAVRDLDSPL